jgi:hypothetical protein
MQFAGVSCKKTFTRVRMNQRRNQLQQCQEDDEKCAGY